MSVASEIQRLQAAKADIKTAIENKGVTVDSSLKLDDYPQKIAEISGGGGQEEAPENDVNFYDYDGFRVKSYTITKAKALTAEEYAAILPPSHDGLTFQEWNWTLNDIQTYDRQYADIGANYITTDGKTHIKVEVPANQYLLIKIAGRGEDVVIAWGDGSTETHTYVGDSNSSYGFEHTYTTAGAYDITLKCENVSTYPFYFYLNESIGTSYIKEINCGDNLSLSTNYSLGYLNCIVSISKDTPCSFIRSLWASAIPQVNVSNRGSDTSFSGYYPFNYHKGRISLPKTIGMATGALASSSTYDRLVVPESSSTTSYNNASFTGMRYVRVISLPNVQFTTLSSGKFFDNCNSLMELDVVQGWTPTQSIIFSASTCWTADTMVKLFNKLGTTTNAITLTFGTTNLDKLSAEEKAIATNKGYTLA